MTEEKSEESQSQEESQDEDNESENVEQKAMLKSVTEGMKDLSGKYDEMQKENVSLKESVSKMAESIEKITNALESPIHKSQGIQKSDAEIKAKADAELKSVDPLELCN